MRSVCVHLFFLFAAAAGTARAADSVSTLAAAGEFKPIAAQLEVPEGKAQILSIRLPEALNIKKGNPPKAVTASIEIRVVERGTAVRAFASVPEWDVAPLPLRIANWKADAAQIALEVVAPPAKDSPSFTAQVTLSVLGQDVTGKATVTDAWKGSREPNVSGTWRDANQERAANPFAAERDWPTHNGRGGLCAAVPIDWPVVDKGTDMRLAWVSECPVP